ncbi:hypothetical protein Dimus_039476 [Dionaea muscipula]
MQQSTETHPQHFQLLPLLFQSLARLTALPLYLAHQTAQLGGGLNLDVTCIKCSCSLHDACRVALRHRPTIKRCRFTLRRNSVHIRRSKHGIFIDLESDLEERYGPS